MMFDSWLIYVVVFVVGYTIYSSHKNKQEKLSRDVEELKKTLAQTQYALKELELLVSQQQPSSTYEPMREYPPAIDIPDPTINSIDDVSIGDNDLHDLHIDPTLDDTLDAAIEQLESNDAIMPTAADMSELDRHPSEPLDMVTIPVALEEELSQERLFEPYNEVLDETSKTSNVFLNSTPNESITPSSVVTLSSIATPDSEDSALDSDQIGASDEVATANISALAAPHKIRTLRKRKKQTSIAEPDEQSLPIVTSLVNSIKTWFFGGNLVVRVGVIVLLMGVVLLLRLLSEYIEIPIEVKLVVIGVIGLGLAGLGLKLVKERFTYGITLQGTGLAIAYLATFFGYRVYHVISSFPSFVMLGALSIATVALAVRQNAFPLALLAFSGAFLAPILTSSDTGSLTTLFGYYLLLNVGIAIIAHYRAWKVLNFMGASVTFGLAYYWGFFSISPHSIESQRWSLSIIMGLHWVLYLFVAIRYAQQILAYNATIVAADMLDEVDVMGRKMLFPIDTGLMFATPLLAFGLISTLLHDIDHALSAVSTIMAVTYIAVGWMLIKRNRHHALLSEGLLALGFGFLALIVPLELDAQWVSFGWSIQGLALVWFGRRSLRAWAILFGLTLQTVAIISLLPDALGFSSHDVSHLALSISALSFMVSMFVLRDANSPINSSSPQDQALLPFIHTKSMAFNTIWRTPILIIFMTLAGVLWSALVTASLIDNIVEHHALTNTGFLSFIMLSNMTMYWLVNRYRYWEEVSWFNHGLFAIYCLSFMSVLPESHSFNLFDNAGLNWFEFLPLLLGWLLIGQLWIKEWVEDYQNTYLDTTSENEAPHLQTSALLDYIQPTLWLGSIIIIVAQLAHYLLPDSQEVMTVVITSISLLAVIALAKRALAVLAPWFNWQGAIMGTGILFAPVILGWAVISNAYHDGVVWSLPYIPVLNLYDIAVLLALVYGAKLYQSIANKAHNQSMQQDMQPNVQIDVKSSVLFYVVGAIGIWIISSIVVRTLHAYADTPLWIDGALMTDKVQIALTTFWSVILLFATYKLPRLLPSFDWHKALVASSYIFIPFMMGWVVLSNFYHDGVIWDLAYIPLLNLYDIAILLAWTYGFTIYALNCSTSDAQPQHSQNSMMLYALGGIGIWIISSILVRTLHTYAGAPLWIDGALMEDKVQICLTIFWSITLLFATYKLPKIIPSFDWHKALIVSSFVFIPLMFGWIILSNWYYDGVVWSFPYIPILNLYDIAILLALAYGLNIHRLTTDTIHTDHDTHIGEQANILLKTIGIIGFWVLSSMLVRTLHAYVDTPLWSNGAWSSDKVQTGLTILWTLTALVATVISSRNGKRFWWFMGIGLLGAVVIKLVIVDLSQTGKILRVVSFIGAGGLMMLIGYLAPLPPEENREENSDFGDDIDDSDINNDDSIAYEDEDYDAEEDYDDENGEQEDGDAHLRHNDAIPSTPQVVDKENNQF